MICDKKIPARVRGKIYKSVVRPAMVYCLKTVELTKKQEAELKATGMKILRFFIGSTKMHRIKNEFMRG